MKALDDFLEEMKNNIPGFIAVAVTDLGSGVSFGSVSVRQDFDPNLASAYNLEVAKAKLKAIKALNLKGELVDILIELTDQIHIIDVASNSNYFIYLAVDSTQANLGLTRSFLNKYKTLISTAL